MVGALWTGISGLGGAQIGLDNESNNIANVNTIGYKASRVSFTDQMYQDKIGKGVTSFDVEKMFTQGNLKLTGVSYDMALSGDGFFQVSDGVGDFYTRAGNFRMGESGTLEDVAKNKVQGWAIAAVQDSDRYATDINATKFTNSFSKLLGNKVIRDTTSIETIIAKATDYTKTAADDSNLVFSGSGWKTASTKIADIEMLMTEYNKLLTTHSNANPKPTASDSSVQKSYLNFNLQAAGTALSSGDEVYLYIDGKKYAQSFEKDEGTTIKKLIDKISDTSGFKAHFTDGTDPYNYKAPAASDAPGGIYIEGLVPGKEFKVTEFGWTDSSNSNQATKGDVATIQSAVQGTGMGGINSVRDALAMAVAGKQQDVYTSSDVSLDGANDFTYQISIYDKSSKLNVKVPAIPLALDNMADIDAIVKALNDPDHGGAAGSKVNTLVNYVKAYNINGNLVMKPVDAYHDAEFTGEMKGPISEVQTLKLSGSITANAAAFVLHGMPDIGAVVAGESMSSIIDRLAASTPAAPIKSIEKIGSDELKITYVAGVDRTELAAGATNGAAYANGSIETKKGTPIGLITRNIAYSGKEGAGAEFLQMTTTINQTASKGDLQLRLDSLGLTDSAFGSFSVDETGLITMQQDGADFAVGQVAVAKFTDTRGLDPVGDNLFKSTNRSGSALFNINNDKTADIKGGTLELSTANLSESLVNLMVFQRAFEANAKSITTADQILTTLIQLKR